MERGINSIMLWFIKYKNGLNIKTYIVEKHFAGIWGFIYIYIYIYIYMCVCVYVYIYALLVVYIRVFEVNSPN